MADFTKEALIYSGGWNWQLKKSPCKAQNRSNSELLREFATPQGGFFQRQVRLHELISASLSARVANSETGQLSKPKNVKVDTMPLNLIHRSFGRLKANCTHEALGLVAAYISIGMSGHWEPAGQPATRNEKISLTTLKAINDFYQNNYKQFMDIKKYRT